MLIERLEMRKFAVCSREMAERLSLLVGRIVQGLALLAGCRIVVSSMLRLGVAPSCLNSLALLVLRMKRIHTTRLTQTQALLVVQTRVAAFQRRKKFFSIA